MDTQPLNATSLLRQSFQQRMRDATTALRLTLVAYMDRLTATHSRSTMTRHGEQAQPLRPPGSGRPGLESLAGLERRRHIEIYLTATAEATNSRTGAPLSASERDIAEWWMV